ncbi:hypothetical protein [Paraburkholderia sp. SIMBA_054]|uniref:hypothetical protein n=1 Tax=Paraburkholderia sp. SIMBA_054 TaxID=3085795 RepID=UPI00397A6482
MTRQQPSGVPQAQLEPKIPARTAQLIMTAREAVALMIESVFFLAHCSRWLRQYEKAIRLAINVEIDQSIILPTMR